MAVIHQPKGSGTLHKEGTTLVNAMIGTKSDAYSSNYIIDDDITNLPSITTINSKYNDRFKVSVAEIVQYWGYQYLDFSSIAAGSSVIPDISSDNPGDSDPVPGRAKLFNGTNQYINVEGFANLGSTFTLSVWVKKTTLTYGGLISKYTTATSDRSFRWGIANTGTMFIYVSQDGVTTDLSFDTGNDAVTGKWTHLCVTFNAGQVKFYIDGVLGVTDTLTKTSAFDTDSDLHIGSGYDAGSELHDGLIFDPRVYSKVLSDAERTHVLTFGETGTDPTTDDCVGWWKLDDTTDTIYDSSGNGNDGTAINSDADFFYENSDVPFSFQDEWGYTSRQNLKLYSEQFDESHWTKENTTVSSDAAVDPNGATTADKIIPSAVDTTSHRVYSDYTSDNTNPFTASIYLKADGYNFARLASYSSSLTINLTNGSYVTAGSPESTTVEDVGDGWWRVSVTKTGIVGTYRIQISVYDSVSASSYAGDTISGVLVWAAQLVNASTPGDYQRTEATASVGLIPRDESDQTNDVLGNALQYSGANHPASLINSNCATFNGVNSYAEFASDITLSGDFEIEGWVNSLNTSNTMLFSGGTGSGGLELYDTTGTLNIYQSGVSIGAIFSSSIHNTGWRKLRLVRIGTDLTIYVDEVQGNTLTVSGNCVVSGFAKRFGSTFFWQGSLCGWKFTDDGTVVAHYPMAEGNGLKLYDAVGTNHADVTNQPELDLWAETQDVFHYNVLEGFSESYKYDGTDDYHDTGFSALPTSGRLDVWTTIGTTTGTLFFCGIQDGDNRIALANSAKRLVVYIGDVAGGASGTGTAEFDIGDIVKLSITWDGSTCERFLDDVSDGSFSYNGDPSTSYDFFIGARNNLGNANLFGPHAIHRVRIADASDTVLYDTSLDGFGTVSSDPTLIRIPAKTATAESLFDNPLSNPAVNGLNDCETQIDFAGGEPDQTWTDQIYRGWGEFDGTASYVQLPDAIGTPSSYNVKLTFNTTVGYNILDMRQANANGVRVRTVVGGTVAVDHNAGLVQTVGTYDDGQDHNVEANWDGATLTLTVDDETVTTSVATAISVTKATRIGCVSYSLVNYYIGNVKDVEITLDDVVYGNYPLIKNTLDHSGNDNHGTNNGVTFAKGNLEASPGGYALFDGVAGTYIDLGSALSLTGDFTYFFRARHTTAISLILAGESGATDELIYHLSATATRLRGNNVTNDVTHGHTIVLGEDYTFAIRRTGSTTEFFKDGQIGTATGTLSETITLDMLGSYNAGTTLNFEGRMSDVQVFDSALTDAQILELHKGKTVAGPILNLPLFEDALDISASGNDGTIAGGVTFPEENLAPAYSYGDGRVAPNAVTTGTNSETQFNTEKL